MQIAVIGSGYVGLVAAACFAELGHQVICVDNDPNKIAALNRGETPIYEQYLPELIAKHHGRLLTFSSSVHDAVISSSVIFIAVGTPSLQNGEPDLSYVDGVARDIAHAINGYKVIVEKSTVPVCTSQWIRRVIQSIAVADMEFDVVSNPEFLREGSAVTDFLYPDRIIIGADNERSAQMLQQVYEPLTSGSYYARAAIASESTRATNPAKLILTSTNSAELIKHASNAFLAMKISFINAVANVCEAIEADVDEVAQGIGTDTRIGRRFLQAGIGYGGSCFPKDVSAFRSVARDCGYHFGLLDEVTKVNEEQQQRFIYKVKSTLWTLRGKRLGVLGLAFKGGTDDVRESPAIAIIRSLVQEQAVVTAYDPAATVRAGEVLKNDIYYARTAYEAAHAMDALLILTDWDEFGVLDLQRVKSILRNPIVIDGRNLYSPETMQEHGFTYVSMGRPTTRAKYGRNKREKIGLATSAGSL